MEQKELDEMPEAVPYDWRLSACHFEPDDPIDVTDSKGILWGFGMINDVKHKIRKT